MGTYADSVPAFYQEDVVEQRRRVADRAASWSDEDSTYGERRGSSAVTGALPGTISDLCAAARRVAVGCDPPTPRSCARDTTNQGVVGATPVQGCTASCGSSGRRRPARAAAPADASSKDLDNRLTKAGVVVANALVRAIRNDPRRYLTRSSGASRSDLADLVARHGTGRGCESVSRSIDRSSHPASPLHPRWRAGRAAGQERPSLQTCRRTGTYSVCPGLPAARSRPKKLIVIGEVARGEFGMYTRSRGGQRSTCSKPATDKMRRLGAAS